MIEGYQLRRATLQDAAVIAHHRATMFHEMNEVSDDEAKTLEASSFAALHQMIAEQRYAGWLLEHQGTIVAGGGLVIRQLLPRPQALTGGAQALIVNVYTAPAHRRRGLARLVMLAMLAWCKENQFASVVLHASDAGRALYESLNFSQTNEMIWRD